MIYSDKNELVSYMKYSKQQKGMVMGQLSPASVLNTFALINNAITVQLILLHFILII